MAGGGGDSVAAIRWRRPGTAARDAGGPARWRPECAARPPVGQRGRAGPREAGGSAGRVPGDGV